jgi:hypothetical protein
MKMTAKLIGAAALAALAIPAALPAQPAAAAAAAAATATERSDDPVSRMFIWWNQAFKTPGAYTAANFRKHFTEDATLILEGRTVISGVEQWATHFQKIQSGGGEVEIVVPFKEMFRTGDRVYTYHVIRSRRGGKAACSLAAGHATLKGDRIASIVLVRAEVDPAKGAVDPQCWTN